MQSAEGRWSSFKDEAFHERWRRLPRTWLALAAASLGDLNEELGFTNPPPAARYRLAGRLLRFFVRLQNTPAGGAHRAGSSVPARPTPMDHPVALQG
jgi:hypothetical protein